MDAFSSTRAHRGAARCRDARPAARASGCRRRRSRAACAGARCVACTRGIYAVAHTALRDEGRWLAAVLACGEGAVLSHGSAARLWRMSSVPAEPAVHVTVRGAERRRPGIVVHRSALTPADVTVQRGVPVTTPARTLVDVAAVVPYETLRAISDHGVRLDAGAVRRAAVRAANRRGRAGLARLLGDDGAELRHCAPASSGGCGASRATPASTRRWSTAGSSGASATSRGRRRGSSSRSTATPFTPRAARGGSITLATPSCSSQAGGCCGSPLRTCSALRRPSPPAAPSRRRVGSAACSPSPRPLSADDPLAGLEVGERPEPESPTAGRSSRARRVAEPPRPLLAARRRAARGPPADDARL